MKGFNIQISFLFAFIFFTYCSNNYNNIQFKCNKMANTKPFSEYHCSGLDIDVDGDTLCCLWEFFDRELNQTTSRCSSIRDDQFQNLAAYTEKKKKQNYTDLKIKCVADQRIYCSNVLLDPEDINDCSQLPIYDNKDQYCCKWTFKDSTNNNKKNEYCASISDYQYITIFDYNPYKEEKSKGKYKKLSIDCSGTYINMNLVVYILFFTSLFLEYI